MKALLVIGFFIVSADVFAVPVYKTPEAKFSSGDLPVKRIYPTGETFSAPWLQTVDGWISRNDVVTALDLAQTANFQKETLKILKRVGDQFLVRRNDKMIKINETSLMSPLNDSGRIYFKDTTPLFSKADLNSKKISYISKDSTLDPISFQGSWVKIRYKNKLGWASLYDVITKLNFANRVKIGDQWKQVASILGPWVTLASGAVTGISQIRGLAVDENLGIAKTKTPIRVLPTSSSKLNGEVAVEQRVILKSRFNSKWFAAKDGYQNTIWIRSTPLPTLAPVASQIYFSFTQIAKRGIFDMAEAPTKSNFKIISAKGIFIGDAAKDKWAKLPGFGDHDYPVALGPNQVLLVGPYLSFNHGRTFQPYLRWDKVVERASANKRFVPIGLHLNKIYFNDDTVTVTVGYQHGITRDAVELRSQDFGRHWHVSNDETPLRLSLVHDLSSVTVTRAPCFVDRPGDICVRKPLARFGSN